MAWNSTSLSVLNVGEFSSWLGAFRDLTNGWFGIAILIAVWIVIFTSLKANRTVPTKEAAATTNFIIAVVCLILFPLQLISMGVLASVWSILSLNVLWLWLDEGRR